MSAIPASVPVPGSPCRHPWGSPDPRRHNSLCCRERMTASECLVHPWIKVR